MFGFLFVGYRDFFCIVAFRRLYLMFRGFGGVFLEGEIYWDGVV